MCHFFLAYHTSLYFKPGLPYAHPSPKCMENEIEYGYNGLFSERKSNNHTENNKECKHLMDLFENDEKIYDK